MAAHSNVPRPVLDSIRENLDRRIKLSIKRLVTVEKGKDKSEQRVLAFSTCRLFVFAAKAPTKMEQSFHYLNIKSIESKKPNQLVLTFEKDSYTFNSLETDTDEINHMITHIGTSLKTVFPTSPLDKLVKKIEVQPADRLRPMYDLIKEIEMKEETRPCGGFTMMYASMCDYHSLPYRDEVAWDVDTIYLSQDTRELCLRDFDHLNARDLMPIIAALVHNTWFTTLNANNVKLTSEVCAEILRVMHKNCKIEELLLSNTGITVDFIIKLSNTLLSTSDTQLHKLDLSGTALDDRAAIHLVGNLDKGRGFCHLDLSRTKLTSKGLNRVAETMAKSPQVFSSLQVLNLAEISSGKAEDLQPLYSFLAQPIMLTCLDLSKTDCELDRLMSPLQRSCSQSLTCLKLSGTTFTNKKMKDVVVNAAFKQFFATAYSLKELDLSGSRMPPEAIKELLLGIGSNKNVTHMTLDLSGIDLNSQGAQNLQNCLSSVRNIVSLNISNIPFHEQDLCNVLNSVGQNKSIRHLAVGRVFMLVKAKNLNNILEEMVHLIQDEDSVLESLSLADSRLKGSMNKIINALGSNTSLTEIDISGNLMGDLGARMLSKALQINNKLKTIMWDKNNTTAQGFEDIADALEKNYTLKKMPLPVYDASMALKDKPERTETALQAIEGLLQRNHSPRKYSSDQAYRLQQGFLISSTQQMVDRLVVQAQDTINALNIDPHELPTDDIHSAQSFIKDADNSKTLLPKLHDLAIESQVAGNPVENKLKQIAADLKSVLESHMKSTVSEMVTCAVGQCETVMAERTFKSDVEGGCVEKSCFPKDFTSNILDGVDTDIFNKLSELNLAVAAHISDRVMDEVIIRLTHSHKTLTNHLNMKRKNMKRGNMASSKPDADILRSSKPTPSPQDSPQQATKRKSMHARKLRPESVIDRELVQAALAAHAGKPLPTPPTKANKTPKTGSGSRSNSPIPKIDVTYANINDVPDKKDNGDTGGRSVAKGTPSMVREDDEEIDIVPELTGSGSSHILPSLTKDRPRRTKNQGSRPSRPSTRKTSLRDSFAPDTGVDDFFSTGGSSSPVAPSSVAKNEDTSEKKDESQSSTPEKKKTGILNFIKDKEKKSGFHLFKSKDKTRSGSKGEADTPPQLKENKTAEKAKDENVDRQNTGMSPGLKISMKADEPVVKATSKDNVQAEESVPETKSAKEAATEKSLTDSMKEKKPLAVPHPKKSLETKKKEEELAPPDEIPEVKKMPEVTPESKKTPDVVPEKTPEVSEKKDETEKTEDSTPVKPTKKEDKAAVEEKPKEKAEEKEEPSGPSPPVPETPPPDAPAPEAEEPESPTPQAPARASKKPMGLGMGFGANVLSEMKLKQEKRMSQMPMVGKKSPDPSPVAEQKNSSPFPIKLRSSKEAKETNGASELAKPVEKKTEPVKPAEKKTEPVKPVEKKTEPLKPAEKKTEPVKPAEKKTEPVKPAEKKAEPVRPPSSSDSKRVPPTGEGEGVESTETSNGGGIKPVPAPRPGGQKPAPPSRPNRPNVAAKPKPMPRRSMGSNEGEDFGVAEEVKTEAKPSTEEPKAESGIVYDSATLKMSVKDKMAKFGHPKPAPEEGGSQKKGGSLLSDSKPSAPSEEQEAEEVKTEAKPSTEEPKAESGIVYDSATLKMSVKDKMAKFGHPKPSPEDGGSQKKGGSLLSDSKPSAPSEEQEAFEEGKTEDKKGSTDSGIGVDTEKMSVKEKALRLSGGATPPDVQKKSGSLPRDAKSADLKKNELEEADVLDEPTSSSPKRPHSMFALLENRPDLKKSAGIREKTDEKKMEEKEKRKSKDSNDNDRSPGSSTVTSPEPDSPTEILV